MGRDLGYGPWRHDDFDQLGVGASQSAHEMPVIEIPGLLVAFQVLIQEFVEEAFVLDDFVEFSSEDGTGDEIRVDNLTLGREIKGV